MRRRSENASSDHFDLLPFVAILMCTLGCLLFITLSIVSMTRPGVGLDPTGQKKKPVLIEWGRAACAIHENGRRELVSWSESEWDGLETANTLRTGTGGPCVPARMQSILDKIGAHSEQWYALFAVRPSGFGSFSTMRRLCEQHNIDVGFYPVDETDKVRLKTDLTEVAR